MADKKYFVLMQNGKDTAQVFHSKQPRGAALKAASRGVTDIHLRERQTEFTCSLDQRARSLRGRTHQTGYLT